MTGNFLLWILIVWGCAALLFGIGVYAGRRKAPMPFWSGTTVDPETVTDIPAYNRANGRLWRCYSLPLWIAGPLYWWWPGLSAGVMAVGVFGGLGWLIWQYRRIERQYIIGKRPQDRQ